MGWISKLAETINSAMTTLRPPMPRIPPILLLCEIMNRPGMSAISLSSSIISEFPEIGIPTGVNPDGTPNLILKLIVAVSEKVIKEIHENGFVSCAIEPGSINIQGTGIAAGVPAIEVTATNAEPSLVEGVMV